MTEEYYELKIGTRVTEGINIVRPRKVKRTVIDLRSDEIIASGELHVLRLIVSIVW